MAAAAAPAPNPTTPAQAGTRGHLTLLPLELLLLITSHLSPKLTRPSTDPWYFKTTSKPGQFVAHADLLALSRTCKRLHNLFTPELIKILLAVKEENPLEFAVNEAHLGLATRLLEDRHVEATEETLVMWIYGSDKWGAEQEKVREKVVWMLIRLGAGKMLGREWMEMMEEAAEVAGEELKVGDD